MREKRERTHYQFNLSPSLVCRLPDTRSRGKGRDYQPSCFTSMPDEDFEIVPLQETQSGMESEGNELEIIEF